MPPFFCHPSAPSPVIPVRDTGIQFSIKMVHFNITFILTDPIKFLDSSVMRWNDKVMGASQCLLFFVIPVRDTGIQDTTLVMNI
ncbi:MAG: hypothetical protein LBK93_04100 [Rickettsiales bacterium]|nr:hypothetical protein [Rickettsiales bacterium]